jgi:hypothetical protein
MNLTIVRFSGTLKRIGYRSQKAMKGMASSWGKKMQSQEVARLSCWLLGYGLILGCQCWYVGDQNAYQRLLALGSEYKTE